MRRTLMEEACIELKQLRDKLHAEMAEFQHGAAQRSTYMQALDDFKKEKLHTAGRNVTDRVLWTEYRRLSQFSEDAHQAHMAWYDAQQKRIAR